MAEAKVEQEVNAANLVQRVTQAWAEWIKSVSRSKPKTGEPFVQANVWAGQYSPCARRMFNQMLYSDELPEFQAETLARFRRGNDRERDLLADLRQVGRNSKPAFTVIGEQERFALKDRNGRVVITGKTDARILFEGIHGGKPFEVKSWSPYLTQGVERFEDLFENRWTRRGAYQLLCYLYGANESLGFILLDRPGLPLLLPVELWANNNHKRVDEFLDKASIAMEARETEIEPDFTDDLAECKACDFLGGRCMPPMMSGSGARLIKSNEVAIALDRISELKEGHKEFEHLDKEVKKLLRGTEFGICGNWLIEGKYQQLTKLEFPDEATKAQFQKVDPKGKFVLKFFRVGAKKEDPKDE